MPQKVVSLNSFGSNNYCSCGARIEEGMDMCDSCHAEELEKLQEVTDDYGKGWLKPDPNLSDDDQASWWGY